MPSLFSTLYRLHFLVPPFGIWVHHNHRSIQARLPDEDPSEILEIGGGLGRLGEWMAVRYPQARVVSVDISEDMLAAARARSKSSRVDYRLQDFHDVTERFDLVLSAGSWEFFALETSTRRAAELLNPGGTLIVSTLRPTPFSRAHARRYARNYGTEIHLHEPDVLAASLRARGLATRWVGVNRHEGSYTLVAYRPR